MTAGVRIATLNLWGTRGDWSTRRGSAKPAFAELDADLITLQETILDGDYDQARDLLGDDYHLAHQSDREPDGPTRRIDYILVRCGELSDEARTRSARPGASRFDC